MEPVVRSSSIFRDFFSAQRDEDQVISKVPKPRILTPEHIASSEDAVVPQSPVQQRDIVSSPSPIVPEKVNDEESILSPKQEQQHEEQQQQQREEEIKSEPAAIVHDNPAEQGAAASDRRASYDYLADLEMIKVLGKGCMGKVTIPIGGCNVYVY